MFTEKDFEKICKELPKKLDEVSIPQELFKYLPEELVQNCTSGRDFIIKEINGNDALKVLSQIDSAYLWVLVLYKIVLHSQQVEQAFATYPSRPDVKMIDLLRDFDNLKEKEEKFNAQLTEFHSTLIIYATAQFRKEMDKRFKRYANKYLVQRRGWGRRRL